MAATKSAKRETISVDNVWTVRLEFQLKREMGTAPRSLFPMYFQLSRPEIGPFHKIKSHYGARVVFRATAFRGLVDDDGHPVETSEDEEPVLSIIGEYEISGDVKGQDWEKQVREVQDRESFDSAYAIFRNHVRQFTSEAGLPPLMLVPASQYRTS